LRYLGGKARIAKKLAEAMTTHAHTHTHTDWASATLIEPFIGGGWVTAQLAPLFNKVYAYDMHEDLVLMWRGVLDGTFVPPEATSREEYLEYRYTEPSAMRGFLGFGMSFSGKWFGGYTGGGNPEEIAEKRQRKHSSQSDYIGPAHRGLLSKAAAMSNVIVDRRDFFDLEIVKGAVLYCDPPYNGTTGYAVKPNVSGKSGGAFDSTRFWKRCEEWAKVADVYVSEESAPSGWEVIWEKEAFRSVNTNNQKATEKLFTLKA
jgi:DNA adenine methylase